MIPYGRQDITEADIAGGRRGAALGFPDAGSGGPALRARASPSYCGAAHAVAVEQRDLGAAPRLSGARHRPGRLGLDQPDHVRRQRQLRALLRRRGRFRRHRPADLQSERRARSPRSSSAAERDGRAAEGRHAGALGRPVLRHGGASARWRERYGFRIVEDASHAIGGALPRPSRSATAATATSPCSASIRSRSSPPAKAAWR